MDLSFLTNLLDLLFYHSLFLPSARLGCSSAQQLPRQRTQTTPVGFEPTRGDPIGLTGRRLSHSAKVSSAGTANGGTSGICGFSARVAASLGRGHRSEQLRPLRQNANTVRKIRYSLAG